MPFQDRCLPASCRTSLQATRSISLANSSTKSFRNPCGKLSHIASGAFHASTGPSRSAFGSLPAVRLFQDCCRPHRGVTVHQATLRARRIVRRCLPASPRCGQAPALIVGHLDLQRETAIGAPLSGQEQWLLSVSRVRSGAGYEHAENQNFELDCFDSHLRGTGDYSCSSIRNQMPFPAQTSVTVSPVVPRSSVAVTV